MNELLATMGLTGKYRVVEGSPVGMDTMTVAKDSEGARLIIEEAMRTDTQAPLYVVCGAGLTNIASAYLLQPEIAQRLTLIWIGGQEYEVIDANAWATMAEYMMNGELGIYLGGNQFIHASSAKGEVTISSLGSSSSDYYYRTYSWGRRIIS